MAIYKYRAKKSSGEIVKGRIEARDEKEAIEKLSQMQCLPMHIEEELEAKQFSSDSLTRPGSRGRIRSHQITIFSRQLASLLKSGVPILKAISIISEQSESQNLKDILRDIYNAVKHGSAFSSSLSQYPRAFSFLYIAMIHAGENSGALPEALLRIADYRERQEEMFSRFRMVLVYPALMSVVGLATVIFMFTFVMPRLIEIFVNMGQDLPLPTQILISISHGLRRWWYWIILILVFIILIIKREMNTKAGRLSLSLFKLHMPIFGGFTLKAELSRFNRTLELLLKNGIPILKAISIAIPVLENEIIKNQLTKSAKELQQGSSFGKSLKDSTVIPLFMSNLIIVGEESGRLEEALGEVARTYERDVDGTIKVMSNLLEPLIILVMGLIVGFIVIAMLLPVFEINV
ncbi:type II secretion system F family protein [Candidatus Omnitrophota bacterium]